MVSYAPEHEVSQHQQSKRQAILALTLQNHPSYYGRNIRVGSAAAPDTMDAAPPLLPSLEGSKAVWERAFRVFKQDLGQWSASLEEGLGQGSGDSERRES